MNFDFVNDMPMALNQAMQEQQDENVSSLSAGQNEDLPPCDASGGKNILPIFPVQVSSFPVASSSRPACSSQISMTSMFPISKHMEMQSSVPQEAPKWLSNQSFPENLILSHSPIPDLYPKEYVEQVSLGEGPSAAPEKFSETFDPASLLSSLDQETPGNEQKVGMDSYKSQEKNWRKGRKKKEQKHKRHRRRLEKGQKADKRHIGSIKHMLMERKSDVRAWEDARANLHGEYYFDTRGDRDNLAFGSLYRMDVARYHCHPTESVLWSNNRVSFKNIVDPLNLEEDGASMDEKIRTEGRYWSGKFALLERQKDFKRLHINFCPFRLRGDKQKSTPLCDFIALNGVDGPQEVETGSQTFEEEESWDDYVMRKTREFNRLTRELPHDESLWIKFANFQDEVMLAMSRKASIQQAIEKKISVLERAIELHPGSEDLLLMLLETCKKKDDISALLSKWENVIMHNPGSFRLWWKFLHLHRGEFSVFSVSSMRKLYAHALQALSAARNQFHHKAEADRMVGPVDCHEVEAEKRLVSMFVDLCSFEWQAGYCELAIGLFQAQIEFNLFAPPIKLSEGKKQRLFQDFWESGAPRIGEDGAAGWAGWLKKEEEDIQRAMTRKRSDDKEDAEEEAGGWTGWSTPLTRIIGNIGNQQHSLPEEQQDVHDDIVKMDEEELAHGDEESVEGEDENVLLERLGLSLDPGKEVEVKDSMIWKRWSEEESRRDHEQWFPIRTKHEKVEDEEELERAILFEDVREDLLTLTTKEARFDLICQFIGFCIGPLPLWCSSNDISWKGKIESLDELSGPLLGELENACLSMGNPLRSDGNNVLKQLVGGVDWLDEVGRANFLRNALLQCRPLFPQNGLLQEILLKAEGYAVAKLDNAKSRSIASLFLAKKLLKTHRQDILLWGAFARIEAAGGNLEAARRVFDTTLTSLSALPKDIQEIGPILYLTYAEAELFHPCNSATTISAFSQQKVLHILCCLGNGGQFTPMPANTAVPGIQLLKARRGFKDQLQNLRRRCIRKDLDEKSTALIACAALFEQVYDGWEAAASVFEEGLRMSLPGKQRHSLHIELLYLRYVAMLEQHKQSIRPAHVQHIVSQGLAQYPNNPQLFSAYIRCCSCSNSTANIHRLFDEIASKNPSAIVWLFAILWELRRLGTGPRIHRLFERALEDKETHQSVVLWRCYVAYELQVAKDPDAARRVFFRAVHSCPWSKILWLDGFQKMGSLLSARELTELQDIMREKELRLRTDVYEILLEEEAEGMS